MTTTYNRQRRELLVDGATIRACEIIARDDGLRLRGEFRVSGHRPSGPSGDDWHRKAVGAIPEGWLAIDETQRRGETVFTVSRLIVTSDEAVVAMDAATRQAAQHLAEGETEELQSILAK